MEANGDVQTDAMERGDITNKNEITNGMSIIATVGRLSTTIMSTFYGTQRTQIELDVGLIFAVNNNNTRRMQQLLQDGASVYGNSHWDTKNNPDEPAIEDTNLLKTAVDNDNGAMLKLLLEYGGKNPLGPELQGLSNDEQKYLINNQKMEALIAAATKDEETMVKDILKSGVSLGTGLRVSDDNKIFISQHNPTTGAYKSRNLKVSGPIKELITAHQEKERMSNIGWCELASGAISSFVNSWSGQDTKVR